MAISDRLNQNSNVAPQAAPAAPQAAPAATKASGQKASDVLKQRGRAIRAELTEDQKAAEGSARDSVAFVAAIGDPTRKQTRTETKQNKAGVAICGYRLKALKDLVVPVCPLKPDCVDAFDCEGMSETNVKAGQIFDMNLVEMTLLISRPEFAGKFSGEGQEVIISTSSTQDLPRVRPIFKLASTSGSIKTNTVMIADIVGKETDPHGKGHAVIKEEFKEKFAGLIRRKSAKKAAGRAATKSGENAADLAAAFGDMYRQKYGAKKN